MTVYGIRVQIHIEKKGFVYLMGDRSLATENPRQAIFNNRLSRL